MDTEPSEPELEGAVSSPPKAKKKKSKSASDEAENGGATKKKSKKDADGKKTKKKGAAESEPETEDGGKKKKKKKTSSEPDEASPKKKSKKAKKGDDGGTTAAEDTADEGDPKKGKKAKKGKKKGKEETQEGVTLVEPFGDKSGDEGRAEDHEEDKETPEAVEGSQSEKEKKKAKSKKKEKEGEMGEDGSGKKMKSKSKKEKKGKERNTAEKADASVTEDEVTPVVPFEAEAEPEASPTTEITSVEPFVMEEEPTSAPTELIENADAVKPEMDKEAVKEEMEAVKEETEGVKEETEGVKEEPEGVKEETEGAKGVDAAKEKPEVKAETESVQLEAEAVKADVDAVKGETEPETEPFDGPMTIEMAALVSEQTAPEPKLKFSWSENKKKSIPKAAETKEWEAEADVDAMQFNPSAQYGRLVGLAEEIEHLQFGDSYLREFEELARQDALLVGAITIEDIQVEEQKLREQHVQFEDQEKRKQQSNLEEVRRREEEAKERLAKLVRARRKQLTSDDELFEQRQRYAQDQLLKSFKRAEKQLMERLVARKAEIQAFYGDLQTVSGKYDGTEGRRWKVDWDRTPQPVQINLKMLRGVKNKLPSGRYVIVVSLYNRLGGMPLRWSRHKDQLWGGATTPTAHSGHFYNTEIKVGQSVFTALPPRGLIKPGMVLVFELFLLRGASVPIDCVVGWGSFPICDGRFQYIEGKYKTPMLRGPMDPQVDSHESIEYLMAMDLDNWLCNLYFEIKCLPRYLAGQKEYEVELQFSSQLLGFPDRIEGDTSTEVGLDQTDQPLFDEITARNLEEATATAEKDGEISGNKTLAIEAANSSPRGSFESQARDVAIPEKTQIKGSDESLPPKVDSGATDDFTVVTMPSDTQANEEKPIPKERPKDERYFAFLGSRALHAWQMRQRRTADDSEDYPWHVMYNLGEQEEHEFSPLLGEPGVYYKYHRSTPKEDYQTHLNTLLPRTPGLRRAVRKLKSRRSVMSELEQHTYAVNTGFDSRGAQHHHSAHHRLQYVNRMLLAELGLSQWRSSLFWITLFMLAFCFFLRMYIHYCGQWVLLTALSIPVNRFDFFAHTVALNFQSSLLNAGEEAALVLLGPLSVLFVFLLLMLLTLVCILTVHRFPQLCSQFVLAFGVVALLDPLLILVVDLSIGTYRNVGGGTPLADSVKLYYRYLRSDGTGLAGVLLVVLIYFCNFGFALFALYVFFIRLYNKGRILDVYWRLHGKEEQFLVPLDLELSGLELAALVRRSELWRGEEGERRKVTVTDYIWEEEAADEEELDPCQKKFKAEVTTHVAIHTVHLDGLRELYRHFLRLPDGAIIEVFGDSVGLSGLHESLSLALQEDTKEMDSAPIPKVKMSTIEKQLLQEDGLRQKKKHRKRKTKKEREEDIWLPWNPEEQQSEEAVVEESLHATQAIDDEEEITLKEKPSSGEASPSDVVEEMSSEKEGKQKSEEEKKEDVDEEIKKDKKEEKEKKDEDEEEKRDEEEKEKKDEVDKKKNEEERKKDEEEDKTKDEEEMEKKKQDNVERNEKEQIKEDKKDERMEEDSKRSEEGSPSDEGKGSARDEEKLKVPESAAEGDISGHEDEQGESKKEKRKKKKKGDDKASVDEAENEGEKVEKKKKKKKNGNKEEIAPDTDGEEKKKQKKKKKGKEGEEETEQADTDGKKKKKKKKGGASETEGAASGAESEGKTKKKKKKA